MRKATKTANILDYSAYWWTNDTFLSKLVETTPVGNLYKRFKHGKRCPYCGTRTLLVFGAFLPGPEHDPTEERHVNIWACLQCGWWYDEFILFDPCFIGWERLRRRVRYLREFAIDSITIPVTALSCEIARHPKLLHEIHSKRFERLVAAVLSEFFDVEVSVLGCSG